MVKRYSSHDYTESETGWLVPKADFDALAAELADWQRMRNEAMAVATSNRERIRELESQMRGQTFPTPDEKDARLGKLEAALRMAADRTDETALANELRLVLRGPSETEGK